MGLMMNLVVIVVCLGIVYCDETDKPVTVTPVTTVASVTPASASSSRVVIENKVENVTVKYSSDHGQNTSYVASTSSVNQTSEKPLIISTSKEMRYIQTPPVNDSIAAASTNSNTTVHHPNEIKHQGRGNHKSHFLPTVSPENTIKHPDFSKYSSPPRRSNFTNVPSPSRHTISDNNSAYSHKNHNTSEQQTAHNPPVKNPYHQRQQNAQHLLYKKGPPNNVGHATEIEMEKQEVIEMRYVESPKDNKKFRYYVAADEKDNKKPSMSSQAIEMTFSNKSSQRGRNTTPNPALKENVRGKTYQDNQTYQNMAKSSVHTTVAPYQRSQPSPQPIIYTVRPRTTNVDLISITTGAPAEAAGYNLVGKENYYTGQRDFSCLRCFGNNKVPKNYKYSTSPTNQFPTFDGTPAVRFQGPEGDNLLGGSKHHYAVAQTEKFLGPKNATNGRQKFQTPAPLRSEIKGGKPRNSVEKRPTEKPSVSGKYMQTGSGRPDVQKLTQNPSQKPRNANVSEGLGSYASPSFEKQEATKVSRRPTLIVENGAENSTTKPQIPTTPHNIRTYPRNPTKAPTPNKPHNPATPHNPIKPQNPARPQNHTKPQRPPVTHNVSQKPRDPYATDSLMGNDASSNFERPQIPQNSGSVSQSKPKPDMVTQKHRNPSHKTRNPYTTDGLGSYASSNHDSYLRKPEYYRYTTPSSSKPDPASDLYNLDDELQASATRYRSHTNVKVETKEIHIPVPEIIETRVPYPIHIKVDRPVAVHIDKPYPVHIEKKVPVPVKINVPHPYPVEKEVPYPVKIPIEVPRPVEVAKPVPYIVENPVPIQVFKHVKVPVKVPVDVPVPYKVRVNVEKRVPYFIERKVTFDVPVPVEKPYLVEVKKPFEVPVEKPQPIMVEKKVPVPVQVVEFVNVPIPVSAPGQHSYQHRTGELSDQHNNNNSNDDNSNNSGAATTQNARIIKIPIEKKPNLDSQMSQTESSASLHQQSKTMKVILPHMISVEFPADFGHQPTGPSSGFLPTASDSSITKK